MNDESTTNVCEDCVNYLTCKKVTAEDENKPACNKFENNFPEDDDEWETLTPEEMEME